MKIAEIPWNEIKGKVQEVGDAQTRLRRLNSKTRDELMAHYFAINTIIKQTNKELENHEKQRTTETK